MFIPEFLRLLAAGAKGLFAAFVIGLLLIGIVSPLVGATDSLVQEEFGSKVSQ